MVHNKKTFVFHLLIAFQILSYHLTFLKEEKKYTSKHIEITLSENVNKLY